MTLDCRDFKTCSRRAHGILIGVAARSIVQVLAGFFVLMVLLGAPAGAAAPRLANLQIEVWPEYDRPAALVILKAELAPDAALPAAVSLRIPASSGGPGAVAFASSEKAELSNLEYQRSDGKDAITLQFSVPGRFFHVEFYDHFLTGASERDYKYVWPGDLPVGRISVLVQEPAGAADFSVSPELKQSATGSEGLRYRSGQFGLLESGKPFALEVRYTKTDSRTSADILKLNAPAAVPVTSRETAPELSSHVLPALGIALPLVLAALTGLYVWWRRRSRSISESRAGAGARFCRHCRHRLAPGDRFCSKCGTAVG